MGLDGVPGSQILARTPQLPIQVGGPQAVPGGPGDADVVPIAVLQAQGQLGHLDTDPQIWSEGLEVVSKIGQWGVLPSPPWDSDTGHGVWP